MAHSLRGLDARVSAMPPGAMQAALETFAEIARERHPGVVLLPLGRVRANQEDAREVIQPFASPSDSAASNRGVS